MRGSVLPVAQRGPGGTRYWRRVRAPAGGHRGHGAQRARGERPPDTRCAPSVGRADVAPRANRPRQPADRQFAGEAVHGLCCRHQPRGKPLHRPRPAVQPQPAQRPLQHASLAAAQRPCAPCLAWRARQLVPWLPTRPPHRRRPDRRPRHAARRWRCAVRHRQHRGPVPLVQSVDRIRGDKSRISGAEDDMARHVGRAPPVVAAVRRAQARCPRARPRRGRDQEWRREAAADGRGERI